MMPFRFGSEAKIASLAIVSCMLRGSGQVRDGAKVKYADVTLLTQLGQSMRIVDFNVLASTNGLTFACDLGWIARSEKSKGVM
mmetsp:Transcript_11911/g.28858  ORF Transcript_11911/g.28858 Transcript_11911/m.28858 type:complete len:83 (+) Transcript_11911:6817-7065(+)